MREVDVQVMYEHELTPVQQEELERETVSRLRAFTVGVRETALLTPRYLVAVGRRDRVVVHVEAEALGAERWDEDHFVVVEAAEVST